MQLILDVESVVNTRTNMSTLEETLPEKLLVNGVTAEELKQNPCNGNKENIQKQDNSIHHGEENLIINNEKTANENLMINNNKTTAEETITNLPETNIKLDILNNTVNINLKSFDKVTQNEEDTNDVGNQTLTNSKFVNGTKDQSVQGMEDAGITVNAEKNNAYESNESHNNVETNNDNDIKKETYVENEIECENDELNESTETKKIYTDDILMKSTSSLDYDISAQVEGQNDNLITDKELPTTTEAVLTPEKTIQNIVNIHKINDMEPVNVEQKNKGNKNNEQISMEIPVQGPEFEMDLKHENVHLKTNEEKATDVSDSEIPLHYETNVHTQEKNEKDAQDTTQVDCDSKLEKHDINSVFSKKENKLIISDCDIECNSVEQLELSKDDDTGKQKNSINNEESVQVILTVPFENKVGTVDDSSLSNDAMECEEITQVSEEKLETIMNDDVLFVENLKKSTDRNTPDKQKLETESQIKQPDTSIEKKVVCRLSNNLDILSDDECEPVKEESTKEAPTDKQCISIEDDDDIMVIEEDSSSKGSKIENEPNKEEVTKIDTVSEDKVVENDLITGELKSNFMESIELSSNKNDKESSPTRNILPPAEPEEKEEKPEETKQKIITDKPLLSEYFLKSSKKKLGDMTREDLEEFCILKIVESIVDRSNLSEIKSKLKTMAQNIDEYRKKAMMLSKQNRDLQVVLKSIQEEQKKVSDTAIVPLKITRSVGMQVLMTDKSARRKGPVPTQPPGNNVRTRNQVNQHSRAQKPTANQAIPVPRLVPANNTAIKIPPAQTFSTGKTSSPTPNGVKNSPPVQKQAEKRPHSRVQSVTVDLTDDEPPNKVTPRSPAQPVRLVPPQNLLAPQRPQFNQSVNSPRKVYIPISSPQNQTIRQTTFIMKAAPGLRPRGSPSNPTRMPQNQVRIRPGASPRHPAPLPDAMKQYQPPNWKALPPAPDLKLSKVENGIVISWKIEGYQEDSYEEIASYQLYAYQETSSPPSTALWKKIGDVKALPLPMACTLTQFMAGFKYYFAVRAVDVRSRLGPFSLPGSILLLNKM